MESGMATHSSVLAWRIPMDRGDWQAAVHGLQRVRNDWVTNTTAIWTIAKSSYLLPLCVCVSVYVCVLNIKISKSLKDCVISLHGSIPQYQEISTQIPHTTPPHPPLRNTHGQVIIIHFLINIYISDISYTNFCLRCFYYFRSLFPAQEISLLSGFTFIFFEINF